MYVYVGSNELFSWLLHGLVEMREPFFYFSSWPCSLCCAAQVSRECSFSYFYQPTKKYFVLFLFLALHKWVLPVGEEVSVASLFPKRNFHFHFHFSFFFTFLLFYFSFTFYKSLTFLLFIFIFFLLVPFYIFCFVFLLVYLI